MKADHIIKNAKIFTSDKNNPMASAVVVKDGKFVYVGDEAGLAKYEGEVSDLGGKFIMPGIIDCHIHVPLSIAFEYADMGLRVDCNSKQAALDFMADYISKNPGLDRYRFLMHKKCLNGEILTKEDLDAICPDSELVVLEDEVHSVWVNSKLLAAKGISDATPDMVPGLSYYVRKDGHVTGNAFESAAWAFLFELEKLTDEQIEAPILKFIDYCEKTGVCAAFEASFPGNPDYLERVYKYLRKMDNEGRLPVYLDGSYMLVDPKQLEEALEGLKRFNREFNTEHLKVHTLKLLMDGTQKIHTAGMVTPYVDTGETGPTTFDAEGLLNVLKRLNDMGMDLHAHTVGERASRTVLDAVEMAKKELGDDFRVRVTCAHLEIQDDADLDRFGKLGVFANFTPYWHCGDLSDAAQWLGKERAAKMFRCKTLWDSGALVTWSCDNVSFDFETWSPYLGMEIGMTRIMTEKTKVPEFGRTAEVFPPAGERMNIEEMLLGYTINAAKQIGAENRKGSIEVGKDADFLVFDKDLLTAEKEGFSYNEPSEVYFAGRKVNL